MKFYEFVIFFIFPVFVTSSITFDNLPQFLDQPSPTIAKPRTRVRLKCAGSTLDSSVRWYYNGILLEESSITRRKRAKDGRNDKHKDEKSNRNMSNYYRPFNKHKRDKSPVNRNKRNTNVKQYINNNKGRFRRKSKSNLSGNKLRFKRDTLLPENFMKGVDIREGKLIISRLSYVYVGDYYCEVANAVGTIRSRTASVLMAELGDFDRTQLPTNVQGEIGSTAVIACQIPSSIPAALSQWKINDSPWLTKSSENYTILPNGDLMIDKLTETSSGNYTCAAYNSILKEKKVAPITTQLDVVKESISTVGSLIFPEVSSTHNIMLSAGEDVLLPCVTNKPVSVTWSRNDENMIDLTSNQEINKAGLLISDVSVQESGKYDCSLNAGENVVYNVSVAKIPNVVVTSPTVFSTLVSMQAKHVMNCMDRNNNGNTKWTWYKNGQLIADQQHITVQENSLTLSPVLSSMSGVYQCVATTTQGQDFATFYEDCKDDSAISATSEPRDDGSTSSETVSYFDAPVDENGLAAPAVTSKLRTNDPVSYRLSWKLPDGDNRVETIAIRCAKASTQQSGSGRPAYTWATQSVPASQTFVVINDLEPSSLYQLELVSVSKDGKTSQIVTTSFRSGEMGNSIGGVQESLIPDEGNNDGTTNVGLPDPPTRPETPSVTPISTTSVSLMWIPRSNGGSPIEGYRVQMREVDNGKHGWYTVNNNLAAGKHSCEVNGLERDLKYRFRVIAFNSGGNSKPSPASEIFPQTRVVLRLKNSPQIMHYVHTYNSVMLEWMYENAIDLTVEGYNIHYRSSDKDNERDYVIKPIHDPVATSDTLTDLTPGILYDIKITAFNSRGTSPASTVVTVELPQMSISHNNPPTYEHPNDDPTKTGTHNTEAMQRVKQRDLIYLIIGGVLGLIVMVLVLSVFCYWRQKAKWNDPKNKINGNGTVNYTRNNVKLPQFPAANGNTPSDTKCTCSRHHSGHSSLERDGSHYHAKHPTYPYMIPADRYADNSSNSPNCPHLHNNPLNMYMEYGYSPYMQSNMTRMPGYMPPNWFVRGGNGNFCHIIPGDSRKMNSDGVEPGMNNFGNGGAMVLGRYHGNMANGRHDGIVSPEDIEAYKQYENNNQLSTDADENAIVHSPKTSCDSDEAATSGVVTQSDVVTLSQSSRLSEDGSEEDKITKSESLASSSDKDERENLIENQDEQSANDECFNDDSNESSSFLNNDLPNNYRKDTVIS